MAKDLKSQNRDVEGCSINVAKTKKLISCAESKHAADLRQAI